MNSAGGRSCQHPESPVQEAQNSGGTRPTLDAKPKEAQAQLAVQPCADHELDLKESADNPKRFFRCDVHHFLQIRADLGTPTSLQYY